MTSECSKFGVVKKVIIFDVGSSPWWFILSLAQRHPEGVISVRFKEPESAVACVQVLHRPSHCPGHKCRQAMNGRFFGGRRIAVSEWDGHTNYQIEETDKARPLLTRATPPTRCRSARSASRTGSSFSPSVWGRRAPAFRSAAAEHFAGHSTLARGAAMPPNCAPGPRGLEIREG